MTEYQNKKMAVLPKKHNFLNPKSIKTQLIIGIAFVHLILMAVFVIDLVKREETFLKQQDLTQSINLANSFAVNSANYLITDDYYFLERITHSYKNFPHLEYAMILTTDNEVVAHTEEKYVSSTLSDSVSNSIKQVSKPQVLINDSHLLDVAVPIRNNNIIIGWVRLGINQDHISQNLQSIVKGGIIYIIIAIILGSIFAIIFANIFTKGLYKLIEVAQDIKNGNRNERIQDLNSNELNNLGDALNKMLDDIVSNESQLNMILENMPVGVWILDADGNIKSTNPAVQEIWKDVKYVGMEEFGLYKARFTDTGKQVEPHEWGAAIVITEKRAVMNQEVEIECFDGSSKIILNSAIPMNDDLGNFMGILVINVDITDRKELELEREKMLTNLLQRNRDLEQFSYIVSHNIRGPLSTLLSIFDLLKHNDISEKDMEMALFGIHEQSIKLDSVITDLNIILNAKKEVEQPKEKVLFSDMISIVSNELEQQINQHQAKIKFDFKEIDGLDTVKNYMHDIFLNLISNAIKFRKPETNPQINIWTQKKNGNIKIYFQDNGIGIDMKRYRNQVFGFYKRFNLNTSGKGMGLFMIKSQISSLGGTIDIESHPDKGTTFIVTLPNEQNLKSEVQLN